MRRKIPDGFIWQRTGKIPNKFIGEQKFALEGGTGAFYVSSNYKQTGKITCHASAPDVEDGNCEIMVTAFTGSEI